jgi:hypothetical protein
MTTGNWRTKSLPLAEWAALQERFAVLQIATGAPAALAMFSKSEPGELLTEIFITGQGIDAIEASSPGGWQDTSAPSGDGVALLVGAGDPRQQFGIAKP